MQNSDFQSVEEFFFDFNNVDINNKKVSFEIDNVAKKSEKSIICRYGETVILTTLCSKNIESGSNFAHLSVIIDEKFYSISKIPSNFNKREGRPSYESIISSRMIDRSLRPFLLANDLEIQIVNTILSVDENFDPKIALCWNSFLVLALSGKIGNNILTTVSVAEVNDEFVFNPGFSCLKNSKFEIFLTFSNGKLFMIESSCKEIDESKIESAIMFAFENSKKMTTFFSELVQKKKNNKGMIFNNLKDDKLFNFDYKLSEDLNNKLSLFSASINDILNENIEWDLKRNKLYSELNFNIKEFSSIPNIYYYVSRINKIFDYLIRKKLKENLSLFNRRINQRKINEIRKIDIDIDYLPNSHGSSLFSRGITQVLSVVTFGKFNEKRSFEENILYSFSPKNFIHHYNFPPFSANEISSLRSVSRREIGHGILVEKTFSRIIPLFDDFPYTTRIVSEVLSADGSSSQASICASSIALMTSGFPLFSHVAGISLGMFEGIILVDIDELEDRIGDIDFKISGTRNGICSLQMDTKYFGLDLIMISKFLRIGKIARISIIEKMEKVIDKPRKNLPNSILKCKKIYIGKENLKNVIGQKGKVIDSIILKTGVNIEFQDDSYALIYHIDEKNIKIAIEIIEQIIKR